ncbi:MAG: bifunctional DNA primase/polymerase [Chloroflexota bacterium]|nr:bifunctional DNA primase/polymerase [Chloroflexota bacterium]
MHTKHQPPIVQAAQSNSTLEASLAYAALGLSVLPLNGKRPALTSWAAFQKTAATAEIIRGWSSTGLLQNVGLICGAVSGNLVALDLDGAAGYPAFAATFPHLTKTFTVATGGGVGRHVYFYADKLPASLKAMGTPIGHLELCAEGRQVVVSPSIHPVTGSAYRVEKSLDILRVADLDELSAWIGSFKPREAVPEWKPPRVSAPAGQGNLNPRLLDAIRDDLLSQGFKPHGEWLHGRCLHPERHRNGDRNPSFGFNIASGYGHCYVCGTLLAKDIAATLNVDIASVGGLFEKSVQPMVSAARSAIRQPAPPSDDPPTVNMSYKLPDWLAQYLEWAGATGNQTPIVFHQAAGLWLLATAVGRRLYGEAPWGVKLYPNLYLMLIAGTTFYRKSTAYKLAEGVARAAIPHMLMPTPGSPERFQEALAGRMPGNYDKLAREQQERLTKAQPFAAQRGLLKDEVAGLFGAINRKDYMVGMKDLLMELYDCPDYVDKDTQTGLNIVQNAALSILGVTTPASLSSAVNGGDWDNGLLIRFALLTPEPDYAERPASASFRAVPDSLINDLRKLHDRLPQPEPTDFGLAAPGALRLEVQCWAECQGYGDWLRKRCAPSGDTELDERLKGVYGRMHVQAFKLASLFAALDWFGTSADVPTVTVGHWSAGQAIAEGWRQSAHRLLEQLDRSGEAVQEKRQQDRLLNAIRGAGAGGVGLRDLYRNLNFSAKQARGLASDLVRAGLIEERRMERAEWFIAVEHVGEQA